MWPMLGSGCRLKASWRGWRFASSMNKALMERLRGESTALAPPDEICDGLYICGLPSLQDNLEQYQRRGVRHILNAADSSLHREAGINVELANMQLHVFEVDAVEDAHVDLLARFRAASAFVAEGRMCQGVLVHCASGISRSSTVCMAHLMISEEWHLSSAARLVCLARPFARPSPALWRQLRWLEERLLEEGALRHLPPPRTAAEERAVAWVQELDAWKQSAKKLRANSSVCC
ncbi:unnamed protein product [Durusdinium trenchii]|uniref:protein-tyrosine-phosphatase n=1 Tax=Durusdinium trenchii TaxID=1381693 RepID=A0ABP0LQW2_9DINO